MGWLVPYVINGASHSAELFRRQAQRPMSEDSGVARIDDLKVVPLPSAGAGFRVMPGAGSVRSRYANRDRESYGVELDSALDVTGIAGTGSTARRDAVVVVVRDPNYDTSLSAEDAAAINYCEVVVVQGVGSAAKTIDDITSLNGVTGYVLAFINWPASQTAVQKSYIEDARVLSAPRWRDALFARPRVTSDSGQKYLTARAAAGGEYFPGGAGYANEFQVTVPEFATRAIISADWMAVKYVGGKSAWGQFWIEFGDEYKDRTWTDKQQWEFSTQRFGFDVNEGGNTHRANWRLMDNVTIPAKLRGKTITVVFKAALNDSTSAKTDAVMMDAISGLGCHIRFVESAGTWEDAVTI